MSFGGEIRQNERRLLEKIKGEKQKIHDHFIL